MMIEMLSVAAPIEVTTTIRPSEAIRLGCLTTRQNFGNLGGHGTACAMGAMWLGIGAWDGVWRGSVDVVLSEPYVASLTGLNCPLGCDSADYYLITPAHLNDDHDWTRERIADWLDSIGL